MIQGNQVTYIVEGGFLINDQAKAVPCISNVHLSPNLDKTGFRRGLKRLIQIARIEKQEH